MAISIRRALFAFALIAALSLTGCVWKKPADTVSADAASKSGGLKIGYAEGVTVVEDPNALQKAVDEMIAKNSDTVGLEYKNDAVSDDGTNFRCYIANAAENPYDMYIGIYADAEFTDELFLSGLVRPGNAFDNITLNHPLEPGSHTVYVAFTQVEEVDGEQVIHAQVMFTMNFTVKG